MLDSQSAFRRSLRRVGHNVWKMSEFLSTSEFFELADVRRRLDFELHEAVEVAALLQSSRYTRAQTHEASVRLPPLRLSDHKLQLQGFSQTPSVEVE